MEANVTNSKKIMLRNGLYLGLATIGLGVIMYVLGWTYKADTSINTMVFLINIAIMTVFIVLGIKQYKTENSGFLTLGEALKIGLGVVLISAIIGGIYNYIFTTVIEPDFTEKIAVIQKTKMLEQNPNLTAEQADALMEKMQQFSSPLFSFLMTIVGSLLLGLLISLIAGLVMQKKE